MMREESLSTQQAEAARQALKPASRLLHERWELLEELGGEQGQTYRARDRRSGAVQVIKLLDVQRAKDWKVVELFEREVETLGALKHPQLPTLIDSFIDKNEEGEVTHLGLVQSYIEGKTLARALRDGLRVDEKRARAMAEELLEILSYLHAQDPPLVHRDIKPANIILGDDERLYLVDFGAAGHLSSPEGGSTIVGSAGYVPAEQLAGRATPAGDLYALGATLVHLLTRRRPVDLPFEQMRLRFRDATQISDEFAEFLEALLAPAPEDRPADAQAALALLRDPPERSPVRWSGPLADLPRRLRPPEGTQITLERPTSNSLAAILPGKATPILLISSGVSIILLLDGARNILVGANLFGQLYGYLSCLMGLISLSFTLYFILARVRIELSPRGFQLVRALGKIKYTLELPLDDFDGLEVRSWRAYNSKFQVHRLRARSRTRPGMNLIRIGISQAEGQWLTELFELAPEPEPEPEPDDIRRWMPKPKKQPE